MRDRIVFFILGAVLATVAYFAGDMNKAGAQDDEKVFAGDVIINGSLFVDGGKIMLHDHFDVQEGVDELSYVSITVDKEGANLSLNKGPLDVDTLSFSSSIQLSTQQMDEGHHVSSITLQGEYGKDRVTLWSMSELNKGKFE